MARQGWNYLQNPFARVTKNNHKRMYLLATNHFAKLKQGAIANPTVQALLDFGTPAFEAYSSAYIDNLTQTGNARMYTNLMKNKIKELSNAKIRRWDIKIQMVFDRKNPAYQSLLPNCRTPFQRGSYGMLTNEVLALVEKLATYPELADLQAEVRTFGEELRNIEKRQHIQYAVMAEMSDELEMKRETLLKVMHYIWAGLVQIYYENPNHVEMYYDLKYLK